MGTAEQQKQELEKLQPSLGNKKLDKQEVDFLKSQKELLLSFKEGTEKSLMDDILEANRLQFSKDQKLNQILDGYIEPKNFELLLKNILQKIPMSGVDSFSLFNKINNTFKGTYNAYKDTPNALRVKLFAVRLLLDAQSGKIDKNYTIRTIYDVGFIQGLHAFQSKTNANIAGRSAADCILGYRTIQQLAAYSGVGVLTGEKTVAIDNTYTKSYEAIQKSNYNFSSDVIKSITMIKEDKTTDLSTKVQNMLQVYKKAPEKSSTGASDPKYTAAVLLITYVRDMLPKLETEEERNQIKAFLQDPSLGLEKYWNAKNSNNKVEKTNDIFKDINKNVENLERNEKKIDTLLPLVSAWTAYYAQKASGAWEHGVQELSTQGIAELQSLKTYQGADRDARFTKAFDKIFFTTEAYSIFSSHADQPERKQLLDGKYKLVNKKISGNADYIETHNKQIEILANMKKIFIDKNQKWDNGGILIIRNMMSKDMRDIDQKWDSLNPWLEGYQSGDAIIREMESYAGKPGSIVNMRIGTPEEKNNAYNADMGKLDAFFADISSQTPDAAKLASFNKMFNLFNQGKAQIKTKEQDAELTAQQIDYGISTNKKTVEYSVIDEQMKKELASFGISLPESGWTTLIKTFEQTKQQIEQRRQLLIDETNANIAKTKQEMQIDVNWYTKQITNYPNDAKKSQWETEKQVLEGTLKTLPTTVDGKTVLDINNPTLTIDSILQGQKKAMFAQILETASVASVFEKNEASINALKNKINKTPGEAMIDRYANIKGVGDYISDETFNTIQSLTIELAIQIAMVVVSAGIANLAVAGTVNAAKLIANSARVVRYAPKVAKIAGAYGRYSEFATAGLLKTVRAYKSGEIIVQRGAEKVVETIAKNQIKKIVFAGAVNATIEGSVFHAVNTTLGNVYQGNDLFAGVNPLSSISYKDDQGIEHTTRNVRGYLESIIFLGIIKEVGSPIQSLIKDKSAKSIAEAMNQKLSLPAGKAFNVKLSQWMKAGGLQTLSVGTELGTMMLADQSISFFFDGGPKDISVKDMTHMIAMILGLRFTHKLKDIHIKGMKRGTNGEIIDIQVNDKRLSEIGKKTPNTINEVSGTYGKNATKEQLMNKREQLNQEITKLKNEGVSTTDSRMITRENAVKLLDGKIANFPKANQAQIDRVKELQRKNRENGAKLEGEIKTLESKKAELETKRQEVIGVKPLDMAAGSIGDIQLIIREGNVLSIGGIKHKYIGIKEGKLQFIDPANKNIPPKEFSSLSELNNAKVNFELQSTPKINGKGKNAIFQELLNSQELITKKKPGEINKQITILKTEKTRIESEIKNIETQKNTYNQNEFFSQNKEQLLKENFWRDGQKHTVSEVTKNGDLKITNNSTGETFTINSFKQLADKGGIQFFAEQGAKTVSTELTKTEKISQEKWNNLKQGETDYMSNRETTLLSKKNRIEEINKDIATKEIEYSKSQEHQTQIHTRRDRLAEVNTELNKINQELSNKKQQQQEVTRLESKYDTDLKTLHEDVVEPIQAKPEVKKITIQKGPSKIENKKVEVPVENKKVEVPVENKEVVAPVENKEVVAPVENKEVVAPVENKEVVAPIENKEVVAPVENKEVVVPVENKESGKIEIDNRVDVNDINTPKTANRLEKLIIALGENGPPKKIDREGFVFSQDEYSVFSQYKTFDVTNRKLIPGLESTLLRDGDLIVSRKKGQRFEVSVDKDGKAYLVNPENTKERATMKLSMINNYKVVKRAPETGTGKGKARAINRLRDKPTNTPVTGILPKLVRKGIYLGETTVSKGKSLFKPAENPKIIKINKYNFIFREETLGNTPLKLFNKNKPGQNTIKGIKTVLNVGTPVVEGFSESKRKSCKDITRTKLQEGDLVVDNKGAQFTVIQADGNLNGKLEGIDIENLGVQQDINKDKKDTYRVIQREGRRDFWYVNGRMIDMVANTVPGANIAPTVGRKIRNTDGAKRITNKVKQGYERVSGKNKQEIPQEKSQELLIDKTNSFQELYSEIDKLGDISSTSAGEVYSPDQLKNIIEQVRKGNLTILTLPKEMGIRTKVEKLIAIEKNTKSKSPAAVL